MKEHQTCAAGSNNIELLQLRDPEKVRKYKLFMGSVVMRMIYSV